MRWLLLAAMGCGTPERTTVWIEYPDGRVEEATDCAKGCSGPTPDDTDPLSEEEVLALLTRYAKAPVGAPGEALDTLLFYRRSTLRALERHGDLLDPNHRAFLQRELMRNRVEVAFRLVDEHGQVVGRASRVSPLKEKQHIVLEGKPGLQHIEISGKTKRVGLHHLWSRW